MTATEAALPEMITAVAVQTALGGPKQISMKTLRRRAKDKTIPGAIWLGRGKLYFQRLVVTRWIEGGHTAAVVDLGARRAG